MIFPKKQKIYTINVDPNTKNKFSFDFLMSLTLYIAFSFLDITIKEINLDERQSM